MEVLERLREGLNLLNIALQDETICQLSKYCEIILEWNKKIALISKGDEAIIERHILDSLSIYHLIKGKALLDFGGGAGFPGAPIRIIDDSISVDIIERRQKKALFLREVKRRLELSGIRIYNQDIREFRAERLYDVITARKVGSISDLVKLTAKFLKREGRIITFKGERLPLEIKEAERVIREQSLCVSEIEDRLFFNGKIVIISNYVSIKH